MTNKELRELSAEELAQRLREKKNELVTLRIRHNSTNEGIELPGRLNTIRKEIARMLTIINANKAVK